MGVAQRWITVYDCERCDHVWIPRGAIAGDEKTPTVCPRCKSPYWNRPRKAPSTAPSDTACDHEPAEEGPAYVEF